LTDEFMTEQEQIEQLKNWLKQYGSTIIAGIMISLVVMSVWHVWDRYHTKKLYHASNIYDELLALRAQNQAPQATVQANKLMDHYPRTPYAQMAALMLARDAVISKNYDEALKELTWVQEHSHVPAFREIAKLRAARILLAQKKPQEALDILKKIDSKSYAGLVDEIRGDAYLQLNDKAKAKDSYGLAMQELPKKDGSPSPLLQMKLDNLSTASDSIKL
jgi:predicted negative regulator of RcsB-dependent stress response